MLATYILPEVDAATGISMDHSPLITGAEISSGHSTSYLFDCLLKHFTPVDALFCAICNVTMSMGLTADLPE